MSLSSSSNGCWWVPTRRIFLIVDRGPAHRAKKTKAFVETLGGRLRLFFLPPYSPDRNPDELVWKHLKADTVGRMVVTDKVDFKRKVISAMRSLQRKPGRFVPSSRNRPCNMPREYELTSGLIDIIALMNSSPSTVP